MSKSIIIVSPPPEYGGSLVEFKLCSLLNEKGFNSKILLFRKNFCCRHHVFFVRLILHLKFFIQSFLFNFKNATLKKKWPIECKFKILPFVSKNTIVIYPEIVYGNPLMAKKIVRWFLFHNRYPNDPNAYGKNELSFAFREIFNDPKYNPTCRLLKINHFDATLYKQTNFGERNGNCYILRKGKGRSDLPKEFDGPIIDNLPEDEKVAVFNRCKYCFDYDTQTFYATIACVCGCIPIVVMEAGKTKSDYLGKNGKDWGRAYGNTPEQIEYAIKTRQKRIDMLNFEESNKQNVNRFIQELNKFFDLNI